MLCVPFQSKAVLIGQINVTLSFVANSIPSRRFGAIRLSASSMRGHVRSTHSAMEEIGAEADRENKAAVQSVFNG